MPLNKFIPLSPDPNITRDSDMGMAQFGHLNTIVDYLNTYVAADSLQLDGTGPLSTTLRAVTDAAGNLSPLKISTTAVQVVSPLRITTDDPSDMYLDCEDGATNNRFNITRNTASQQVNLNFASNPAGSTTIVGAIRTYVDGVNLSEVMTFREDGNVGIGTNAPAAKLTIDTGDLLFTTPGNSQIYGLRNGVNQDTRIIINNQSTGGLHLGAKYGNPSGCIYFECGLGAYTERMRLTPNGNLLIGTTSDTARLNIVGSGSTSATTSLLVQNSLGNAALTVTDDRNVSFGGGGTFAGGLNLGSGIIILNNGGPNTIDLRGYTTIMRLNASSSIGYFDLFKGSGYSQISSINEPIRYGAPSHLFGGTTLNYSAIVNIESTTQGFLKPRMTTAQKNAIASPAAGLEVYDTDLNRPCFYSGSAWVTL